MSNLNQECQHAVWESKANLMKYDYLSKLIENDCDDEDLQTIRQNCLHIEDNSQLLSCILDKYNLIKNLKCHNLVFRISLVAFSDFRLFSDFMKFCENDIQHFKCGRIQSNVDVSYFIYDFYDLFLYFILFYVVLL